MIIKDQHKESGKDEILLDRLSPPSRPIRAIGNILTFLIVSAVICLLSFVKVPYEKEVEVDSFHFVSPDTLFLISSKQIVSFKIGQRVELLFKGYNTRVKYSGVIINITKQKRKNLVLMKVNGFVSKKQDRSFNIAILMKNKVSIFQCFELGNQSDIKPE